jgi:hypothetical protein
LLLINVFARVIGAFSERRNYGKKVTEEIAV